MVPIVRGRLHILAWRWHRRRSFGVRAVYRSLYFCWTPSTIVTLCSASNESSVPSTFLLPWKPGNISSLCYILLHRYSTCHGPAASCMVHPTGSWGYHRLNYRWAISTQDPWHFPVTICGNCVDSCATLVCNCADRGYLLAMDISIHDLRHIGNGHHF